MKVDKGAVFAALTGAALISAMAAFFVGPAWAGKGREEASAQAAIEAEQEIRSAEEAEQVDNRHPAKSAETDNNFLKRPVEGTSKVSIDVSAGISFGHSEENEYFFEGNSVGDKFFNYTLTNGTEKTITEYEYCMLAYDWDGNPLKVCWLPGDSGKTSGYECVVKSYEAGIEPGKDYVGEDMFFDADSTWSFIELGVGEEYRVEMVLYCLKQITFEDGSVWENPDYENWLDNCKGKKVPVDYLRGYYPCEYAVDAKARGNH